MNNLEFFERLMLSVGSIYKAAPVVRRSQHPFATRLCFINGVFFVSQNSRLIWSKFNLFPKEDSFALYLYEFFKALNMFEDKHKEDFNMKIGSKVIKIAGAKRDIDLIKVSVQQEEKELLKRILSKAEKSKTENVSKEVIKAVKLCLFSCSDSRIRPELNSIYINGKDVVSSDRVRVSRYRCDKKSKYKILIPRDLASNIPIEDFSYCGDDKRQFLIGENVSICYPTVNQDYPDYKRPLKFRVHNEVTLPKQEMRDFIKASVDFAKMTEIEQSESEILNSSYGFSRKVKIRIGKKKIVCEARNRNVGKIHEEIKYKNSISEMFTFVINPTFLGEIIEMDGVIKVGDDRILFESGDGKFNHLIALFKKRRKNEEGSEEADALAEQA